MSVFVHSYGWAHRCVGLCREIPGNVKHELRTARGLIFLIRSQMVQPHIPRVYCGDSSLVGYAFQHRPTVGVDLAELRRWKERWRFSRCAVDTAGADVEREVGWTADTPIADTAFARWFVDECGLRDLNGEQVESSAHAPREMFERRGRMIEELEVVGQVPRLPAALLDPTAWSTVVERR